MSVAAENVLYQVICIPSRSDPTLMHGVLSLENKLFSHIRVIVDDRLNKSMCLDMLGLEGAIGGLTTVYSTEKTPLYRLHDLKNCLSRPLFGFLLSTDKNWGPFYSLQVSKMLNSSLRKKV